MVFVAPDGLAEITRESSNESADKFPVLRTSVLEFIPAGVAVGNSIVIGGGRVFPPGAAEMS